MASGTVIVPIRDGSDGDATHRPDPTKFSILDPPAIYLEKIGTLWMQDRGEALPGVRYLLQRLPAGYAVFERPRPNDPKHLDKYLYGHPSHKAFDSPNRFWPHFKYLMENGGDSMGCTCTVCRAKGGSIPPMDPANTKFFKMKAQNGAKISTQVGGSTIQTSKAVHKGRPKLIGSGMDTSRVDEEGTPDVYRNLIDKLKRHGTLDETITESMSMDWRAEQEILPTMLKKLRSEPQWLPRTGDLVLFIRTLPPDVEICQDKDGGFQFYDHANKIFVGYPTWEAGVVGQPPAEDLAIDDLVAQTEKEMGVSYSGCRIEPLPDPNDTNKSLSKRYKYVPLHHTRPFIFWKEFLGHIPEEQWHPTVKNALTVMSSFSLMGKHRFRGTWPNASIHCHGIYIGSELLSVGDTVRLLPKSPSSTCTDVLIIKSIRLKLSNLDLASDNDYDEGRPYNSTVLITGPAYTSDLTRLNKEYLTSSPPPRSMSKYPEFYPLHPPSKELQISFSRILGRLFEADAMTLWFPSLSEDMKTVLPPDLSLGVEGVVGARQFARERDRRIEGMLGSSWFWGDTRAEALDLETVNGLEVGRFDRDRNPKEWRKMIKTMDMMTSEKEREEARKRTRVMVVID
ncbi:hypothetical protein K469DRAFT_602462 [Zopfia rhizophila CBS 207.26]|uniref:Cryptic loci regulator 2 N-terminal domain-containing protein n=1 Tax=Zopfia rhizophila CBS 207.26 TaxID=1314779 RepID=A0A6A6DGT0_9PEZI|nr:hypothetical protein K469DRAFT_602462 [Zopfia rhizophila CBS 207.26]